MIKDLYEMEEYTSHPMDALVSLKELLEKYGREQLRAAVSRHQLAVYQGAGLIPLRYRDMKNIGPLCGLTDKGRHDAKLLLRCPHNVTPLHIYNTKAPLPSFL